MRYTIGVAVGGDEVEAVYTCVPLYLMLSVGEILGKAPTGRSCKRPFPFGVPTPASCCDRQGASANAAEISGTHPRQSFQQDQLERARLTVVLA